MTKPIDTSRQSTFVKLATATAFAALLAYAVVFTITPAAINEIGREYHVSNTTLGWLFRMMMGGFFAAVLIAGRYSDKKGKLPTLLVGCLLMMVGLFMFSMVHDFRLTLLAVLIAGIGGGSCEGTAMATVTDLYSGSRKTAVLNISQAVFCVGAVAGPIAIGQLISAGIDWRIGYMGASVLCILGVLLAAVTISMKMERPLASVHEDESWKSVIRDPLVLWLSLALFLYVGAENGPAGWLAAFFEKDLHSAGSLAAYSVAVFWGGVFAGRIAMIPVTRFLCDTAILRWTLAFGAAVQVILVLINTPTAGLLATFALGCLLGPIWPTIVSLAGSAYPRQSGTVLGVVVACGALGAAIVPPLVGHLADLQGMRIAMGSCALLSLANFIIFLTLRTKRA